MFKTMKDRVWAFDAEWDRLKDCLKQGQSADHPR